MLFSDAQELVEYWIQLIVNVVGVGLVFWLDHHVEVEFGVLVHVEVGVFCDVVPVLVVDSSDVT